MNHACKHSLLVRVLKNHKIYVGTHIVCPPLAENDVTEYIARPVMRDDASIVPYK